MISVTTSTPRLGVLRCALTSAIGLALLFLLCWVGALFLSGATHAFIGLFTSYPTTSFAALFAGLWWSAAFGALAGSLVALVYNALGFIDERGFAR